LDPENKKYQIKLNPYSQQTISAAGDMQAINPATHHNQSSNLLLAQIHLLSYLS